MQSGAEWFEATVDPNPLRKHVKDIAKESCKHVAGSMDHANLVKSLSHNTVFPCDPHVDGTSDLPSKPLQTRTRLIHVSRHQDLSQKDD